MSTWLGGVCCVPKACLKIDKTIIILVNAVIPRTAGEKIAATSGLAFAAQIDPTSGAQSPVISQIFQLFLLILFFSVNGHLIVFELFYKSYDTVPIGSFYNFKDVIEKAITSTNSIYENAVIIVLPIVSILFFMNLGIGNIRIRLVLKLL